MAVKTPRRTYGDLPSANTPLAGTEWASIEQDGRRRKVAVSEFGSSLPGIDDQSDGGTAIYINASEQVSIRQSHQNTVYDFVPNLGVRGQIGVSKWNATWKTTLRKQK